MDKFKNRYRIESTRLQNWDYGWNGAYFVTICTYNHACYFGHIESEIMHMSETGCLAEKFWLKIPDHFPNVHLSAFVVMPNHIHGIIIIDKPFFAKKNSNGDHSTGKESYNGTIENAGLIENAETRHTLSLRHQSKIVNRTPGDDRFRNQGKNTISSIVGSYKSVVTRESNLSGYEFKWQSRFWDYIIRDINEFFTIKRYIINNPQQWIDDDFFMS